MTLARCAWIGLLGLAALGCRMPSAIVEAPAEPPTAAGETAIVESPGQALTEPTDSDDGLALADYFSFLGLECGDDRAQVESLLGAPAWIDPDAGGQGFDTYYYVVTERWDATGPLGPGDEYLFDVSISTDDDLVLTILARHYPGFDYATHAVADPRVDLLGGPVDQVLTTFGEPLDVYAGFHSYSYEEPGTGRSIGVEFVCYDHDGDVCNEIWVNWYGCNSFATMGE